MEILKLFTEIKWFCFLSYCIILDSLSYGLIESYESGESSYLTGPYTVEHQ